MHARLRWSPVWSADDLAGAGAFGLLQSIERFDPSAGVKFSTFAQHRICGSMIDGLRNLAWQPRGALENHERCRRMVQFPERTVRTFDAEPYEWDFAGAIPARSDPIGHALDRSDWWARVTRGLSAREREAVLGVYRDGQSMKDAAAAMGLSESRVSQLLQRARSFIEPKAIEEPLP